MKKEDLLILLQIVEYCRDLPKLKTIHDKAMKDLEDHAKSLEPSAKEDWEKAALATPKPLPTTPPRRAEVQNG